MSEHTWKWFWRYKNKGRVIKTCLKLDIFLSVNKISKISFPKIEETNRNKAWIILKSRNIPRVSVGQPEFFIWTTGYYIVTIFTDCVRIGGLLMSIDSKSTVYLLLFGRGKGRLKLDLICNTHTELKIQGKWRSLHLQHICKICETILLLLFVIYYFIWFFNLMCIILRKRGFPFS